MSTFEVMENLVPLTAAQWAQLATLAEAGEIPITGNSLKAIRYGRRRWTEDLSIRVHEVTKGEIPCWATRPDLFNVGVLPPCLDHKPSDRDAA